LFFINKNKNKNGWCCGLGNIGNRRKHSSWAFAYDDLLMQFEARMQDEFRSWSPPHHQIVFDNKNHALSDGAFKRKKQFQMVFLAILSSP
jgi:hypothetical protein